MLQWWHANADVLDQCIKKLIHVCRDEATKKQATRHTDDVWKTLRSVSHLELAKHNVTCVDKVFFLNWLKIPQIGSDRRRSSSSPPT